MRRPGQTHIELWRDYLDELVPSAARRHEAHALHVCRLAVDAARRGTYGVGALLCDADGRVLIRGHNSVYDDGFRSDLHAEMVVMNEYESLRLPRDAVRECTLVTSLEPCPMCMTRLIVAGVGTVLYVADDPIGGMVRRKEDLPPTFRAIMQSQKQVWAAADCSDELRSAALSIWVESRKRLGQWLPGEHPQRRPGDRVAS